jgi:hypothetical protein
MTILQTKICNKCKRELPATSEYFYKIKGELYKMRSVCKNCLKNKRKLLASTQEYKEKWNLRAKKWRENNPEKFKKIQKTFRSKNKDSINAIRVEKYNSDPEYREKIRSTANLHKRNKEHFSPEDWKKELAKRTEYRKNLSEKAKNNFKLYQERFFKNNPNYKIQMNKKRRDELYDSYIVEILHKQTEIDAEFLYNSKELIDLKRNQIKLLREVNNYGK